MDSAVRKRKAEKQAEVWMVQRINELVATGMPKKLAVSQANAEYDSANSHYKAR